MVLLTIVRLVQVKWAKSFFYTGPSKYYSCVAQNPSCSHKTTLMKYKRRFGISKCRVTKLSCRAYIFQWIFVVFLLSSSFFVNLIGLFNLMLHNKLSDNSANKVPRVKLKSGPQTDACKSKKTLCAFIITRAKRERRFHVNLCLLVDWWFSRCDSSRCARWGERILRSLEKVR